MAEGKRTVGVVKPMRSNALPAVSEPIEPVIEPKVCPFSVRAHWLTEDDCRLDASFYADEVVAARRVVEDSGLTIKPLGDPNVVQRLFWPLRFKRVYTDDPNEGFPFLQASEALMFRPQMQRWLARSKVPNAEDYFAKEGWILVTRSGVVGRCVLVGKRLAQFFLSEDLIRIVPVLLPGYLYAYLSSWIGQALMVKEQYGMTVTHLEPQHLARLPVPLLPDDEQQAIHEQIMQAYRLRDEANDLLDKADELLHAELSLPRFDESQVPYLFGSSKPKAFTVRATELEGRLDASFHIPIARAVIEQLRKGKYPPVRLGDVAIRIFIPPRFKRIYVSPEYGVPFLQGSHVLVTRSGTVGRLTLVPKALDGWAASEHCLRIVPNPERVHAGYLAAFLMTPYGQHQLTSKIYGGVVDELTEEDTAAIWLPDAPLEVQQRIGTLVVQAFEKKEEANAIEDRAIARLENILARGKGSIMPSRKGDAA
jgi:type I restriction enzyme S subunit